MADLRAAINSTQNGFLITDKSGKVSQTNPLFAELIGWSADIHPGDEAAPMLACLAGKSTALRGQLSDLESSLPAGRSVELEVRLDENPNRILQVISAPLGDGPGEPDNSGRVWTVRDLTSQRTLEEGLRQSQKMDAVGQLAGGVAHDFNNLLTGILGNLALVELELGPVAQQPARDKLRSAIKAGERAAELVRQLLGFSRRSPLSLSSCDANNVVTEINDILSATFAPGIRIEMDLTSMPWRVMADVNMLSQVLMNMAFNAKDAMPAGGTLRLSTGNHFISEEEAERTGEAKPGQFLRLSVEDDGTGISREILPRIFEPFFTTKPPGKGTGLGLATSFGIIKQLGGWIEVRSTPGQGTRFDIYLPRDTTPAPITSAPVLPPSGFRANPDHPETILVVDDEDLVRQVSATLFAKLGYHVCIATDGDECLRVFAEGKDKIDLVLMDLTMPNLSGKETFRLLRQRYDPVPVLICSGDLLDLESFSEECGTRPEGFVRKPYRLEELAGLVRRTLDAQANKA